MLPGIGEFLNSYKHPGDYQEFDWDTFQWLPDEITGIRESFHLGKGSVIDDSDWVGYTSYYYDGMDGQEISALENFYLSVYGVVEDHIEQNYSKNGNLKRRENYHKKQLRTLKVIPLFPM